MIPGTVSHVNDGLGRKGNRPQTNNQQGDCPSEQLPQDNHTSQRDPALHGS